MSSNSKLLPYVYLVEVARDVNNVSGYVNAARVLSCMGERIGGGAASGAGIGALFGNASLGAKVGLFVGCLEGICEMVYAGVIKPMYDDIRRPRVTD